MESLKSIWQKVFLSILCLAPVAMIAGIIDYRFHNYFWPSAAVFRPIEPRFMFDFFSVLDFYTVLVLIIYVLGTIIFQLNLPKLKWHWSYAPILLIGAGIIVSYIFFEPVEPRIKSPKLYITLQYIAPIALFLVSIFSLRQMKWRERFLKILLASFAVFGAVILLEFFTDALPGPNKDFLHRLMWPYIDPFYDMKPESANWLAYLFGPIAVLAFMRTSTRVPMRVFVQAAANIKHFFKPDNLLNVLALVVSGLVLIFSKSYAGILITGALISWWTFLHLKNTHRKKILAGIVILVALAIASQYNTDKFQVLLGNYRNGNYKSDNSIVQRVQIYNFNWESFKERPFIGIGPTNYQNYFRRNMKEYLGKEIMEREIPPHAHSLAISVWSDLGIFGLVAMVILYAVVARNIFGHSSARANMNMDIHMIGHVKRNYFYFVFAYYLGHGLVDTPYGLEEVSVLFWLLLGLAVLREKYPNNGLDV